MADYEEQIERARSECAQLDTKIDGLAIRSNQQDQEIADLSRRMEQVARQVNELREEMGDTTFFRVTIRRPNGLQDDRVINK
jgi:chromosome segregation ATPase